MSAGQALCNAVLQNDIAKASSLIKEGEASLHALVNWSDEEVSLCCMSTHVHMMVCACVCAFGRFSVVARLYTLVCKSVCVYVSVYVRVFTHARVLPMSHTWQTGTPPLYIAAFQGNAEMIALLLRCGANVNLARKKVGKVLLTQILAHAYTYTHIRTHTHTHSHTYAHTHTCAHTHTYIHTNAHTIVQSMHSTRRARQLAVT
jgi:hypothetical protein